MAIYSTDSETNMNARDPKIDPKPGDVIKNNGKTATVTECELGFVRYIVDGMDGYVTLRFWRSRGKDIEVLKVAE